MGYLGMLLIVPREWNMDGIRICACSFQKRFSRGGGGLRPVSIPKCYDVCPLLVQSASVVQTLFTVYLKFRGQNCQFSMRQDIHHVTLITRMKNQADLPTIYSNKRIGLSRRRTLGQDEQDRIFKIVNYRTKSTMMKVWLEVHAFFCD